MSNSSLNPAVVAALSHARLSTYPGADDTAQLVSYAKNVKLSESLYPVLQHLEIAIRNRWEVIFTKRFGSAWYDDAHLQRLFDDFGRRELQEAKSKLSKRSRPHSSDAVVAELNFGFWTSLFGTRYEKTLWIPNTRELFPYALPSERDIRQIRGNLTMLRQLRNRIAHHEPILTRSSLWADYETILKLLGWISPELQQWLGSSGVDRFPEVYRNNRP